MRKRVGMVVVLALAAAGSPAPASAQLSFGVSVRLAPPPLPVYAQPPLPGPDYLWTPGYWAWDDVAGSYFWVPGTWVRAPRPGLLWTPPWWGWSGGAYLFHAGYWGPHIGFYGGVPYGFGYTGFGFAGGYWNGGHVFYNSSVTNVTNVHVTNVYRSTVVENRVSHVSYNGGPGGVQARPTAQEQAFAHEGHVAPTAFQQNHLAAAHQDPRGFASANRGRPPVAATARPLGGGGRSGDGAFAAAGRGDLAGSGESRPGARSGFQAELPGGDFRHAAHVGADGPMSASPAASGRGADRRFDHSDRSAPRDDSAAFQQVAVHRPAPAGRNGGFAAAGFPFDLPGGRPGGGHPGGGYPGGGHPGGNHAGGGHTGGGHPGGAHPGGHPGGGGHGGGGHGGGGHGGGGHHGHG